MAEPCIRVHANLGDDTPGIDRVRPKYGTIPTAIGDVLRPKQFPFVSWAASVRFAYPIEARPFLTACGSAAEAFLVRPFLCRTGVVYDGAVARCGRDVLRLQEPAGRYRLDAVVRRGSFRLAIEVDGMAFHHRSREQVADDYLRQRRIVCMGYTVIRFTAQEAFADPEECWRQINAILEANS